jgi:hypothetical protein
MTAAPVGWARVESAADGQWQVRTVPGARALALYRCPGCEQEIRPGMSHLVAWPLGPVQPAGPALRRHWHTACWSARGRRDPGR